MMRKVSLVVLTSLIVLTLAACNSAPAPAPVATGAVTPAAPVAQTFPAERAALQAGDTATAIAGLEKAIATTPGSAEAHLLLGQAYFRAQRKDEASQQFMAGFSLDPKAALPLETKDADELLLAGNAHASLNQFDEALAIYQTVLQLNPNRAAAHTNIGVVYYQAGRFDDAVAEMKKALEIDPKDAQTEYMLGATYVQQQKLDEAEKLFNQAIELQPDLAAAYTGLGNVYLARKNVDKAVSTLQKAAELKPSQAETWLALGQAYALQGNKAEAVKALNRCVQTSQPGPLYDQCNKVLQQVGTP
jgi:tetratricopeptide (TPR) repeat protein